MIDFHDRAFESIAGNKQIHAHQWGELTDLHIGQEDNAQMYRVDTITDSDGQDNRHDNDQCGEDIQHHPQHQQKQVQYHQERPFTVNVCTDGIE